MGHIGHCNLHKVIGHLVQLAGFLIRPKRARESRFMLFELFYGVRLFQGKSGYQKKDSTDWDGAFHHARKMCPNLVQPKT